MLKLKGKTQAGSSKAKLKLQGKVLNALLILTRAFKLQGKVLNAFGTFPCS
jgi:hypothetical protein